MAAIIALSLSLYPKNTKLEYAEGAPLLRKFPIFNKKARMFDIMIFTFSDEPGYKKSLVESVGLGLNYSCPPNSVFLHSPEKQHNH